MADKADKLNPGERTAAEADYHKKFDPKQPSDDESKLKDKESAPDASWKTDTKKKPADETVEKNGKNKGLKKGRFGFVGRRAGAVRNGSAFAFIIAMVLLGVAYTSVFAPNIMLVNIKEMYTNDLADSTIALDTFYKKMMNYKIGHSNCGEKKSIKCKLSTMSRAQKKAFENKGFTVLGSKVEEDHRDDSQPGNEKPETRYQVMAIIPPVSSTPIPIVTGDLLWAYGKLSDANKSLVYSVFNPKSSFYLDARFRQRIKAKYDLTKTITTSGTTEKSVNKSFDSSMTGSNEGIGLDAQPNTTGGIGLGSLRNPITAAQIQAAAIPMATATAQVNSFVALQCVWYSLGKAITNDAKTAKAHTVARFAMQYLKAADQIKAGTSEDITINTLSSNLAKTSGGGYDGANATDASMYKSIVYGSPPIPSPFGFLYYLDTFDLIGAMFPSWVMIMASATAQGKASNVSGTLSMPPANLTGGDRDYCLGGETTESHETIKNNTEEKCAPQILASAPPGFEGLLTPVVEQARQTCPVQHYDNEDRTVEGLFTMQPSVKATSAILTPLVAGLFSANVIVWANVMYNFFTSQTTGVAASDAIFAGTGEVLGDMAQSRGMMPSNVAFMGEYLAQKPALEKEYEQVARYNARKSPFDAYNQYSFLGSIVHSLSPTYDSKTPLFSSIANGFSMIGSSLKQLNQSANAIYYLQPDPFNPLRFALCPDPEYLAIGITADVACNVRYSMTRMELAAQPDSVLDYMLKSHSDLTQDNIDELQERAAKADQEGDLANVTRMLTAAKKAANQPQIDKETGRAMEGSEYEKFLQYCVNRQDPWGRSGIAVTRTRLSNEEVMKRLADKTHNLDPVSPSDSGDPYQETTSGIYPSVSEGAKADQDWYTGKKCLDQSEELTNFRAYTMLCSVDGSLSGSVDCTYPDNSNVSDTSNEFYSSNDILYKQ
jgi:hypothetical protein